MSIILGDPDTFVQWNKIDNPGENPKWESQCGVIEQIGFGDTPLFQGYIKGMPTNAAKTNLYTVKKDIETIFKKHYPLEWAYDTAAVQVETNIAF